MLCWPDATVELHEDPEAAADQLVDLLARNDGLEQQRRANIFQTIAHHDWRYRIRDLCTMMELPVPPALLDDLSLLKDLGSGFGPAG